MAKAPPPTPKTPPKRAPAPPKAPPRSTAPVSTRAKKTFTTAAWDTESRGKKIVIYGSSGMGKTTLAALAPNPLFIALEEGGLDINNPRTGAALNFVSDVDTYEDVLDVMDQSEILDDFETLVIDSATELEQLAIAHMLHTVPAAGGSSAANIESYGYGKGFQHLHDIFRIVLSKADQVVKRGKNVIFLAQMWPIKTTNAESDDFLKEAPLLSNKNPSNVAQLMGWCSHMFRIGHPNLVVEDRKVQGDSTRAVFVHDELWFHAKSRTIPTEWKVISFDNPKDDEVWRLLFDLGRLEHIAAGGD